MFALLLRLLILWLVPGVALAAGVSPDALTLLLSVFATICEIWLWISALTSSKRRSPPWRSFFLRLACLCTLQVWSLLLHESMRPDDPDSEPVPQPKPIFDEPKPKQPEPMPEQPEPMPKQQMVRGSKAKHQVAPPKTSAPSPSPRPLAAAEVDAPRLARGSLAVVGEGNFVVDAPPEDLRWSPRTISVVLPCAEERDLAFKTVKSVFDTTPADVLHEIVVVDDGSNPPLSQTHLKEEIQEKYKILIKRHDRTVGLIGAKKTGGDAATGDLIVFFDCHVAPQPRWHEDFLRLISENYRRMVIPQITALDIDSWTQIGRGGGMSKCYLTWDGDFKWGGTDDMYMGMLSGGLAGMSRQWWDESGGYDDKMLGWGGENIDQGVRMWVCGGEIVAAPNSQVAHMWRTGSAKTSARYKHVGDTIYNRARAINAWLEEFSAKLDDYPSFAHRKSSGGPNWFGDMSTFNNVRKRLNGCRPFAWYLKRFKVVYEDAGLIPPEIFMIREDQSGLCLRFMGGAGTSGSGSEGVRLDNCDQSNHRFFWHLGNRNKKTKKCCSGLRAWNTDQCLQGGQTGGRAITGICELSGTNPTQAWSLTSEGLLKKGSSCLGPANSATPGLKEAPCLSFRNKGGSRFTKMSSQIPLETKLYRKAQQEHPEVFARLNAQLNEEAPSAMPKRCLEPGKSCMKLFWKGGTQCLDGEAQWVEQDDCVYYVYEDGTLMVADPGSRCLDTWSDEDVNTWGLYECHGGNNQKFLQSEGQVFCAFVDIGSEQCFEGRAK